MNHAGRAAERREASWHFLEDHVRADVALLQETAPPAAKGAIYGQGGIGKARPWGSAILAPGMSLEPIDEAVNRHTGHPAPLLLTHPGCTVIARWDRERGGPVVFISMYGLIDHGYAITTVHRLLSDLTPLLDSRLGQRVILERGPELLDAAPTALPHLASQPLRALCAPRARRSHRCNPREQATAGQLPL